MNHPNLDLVEDGEFSNPNEPKNNLPVQFGAFPIAIEQERLERVKHDMELNKKLGLHGQNKKLANEVKSENIERVMDKTKYPEINEKGLLNLFGVSGLNWDIWKHNLKIIFKYGIAIPLFCVLVLAGGIEYLNWLPDPNVIIHKFGQFMGVFMVILAIATGFISLVLCLGSVVFFIMSYASFFTNETPIKDNKLIKLSLTIEDLATTRTMIPYGAKLMLSEAMDSKLFQGFHLVKPDITELYKKRAIPKMDPAFVGVMNLDGEEKWFLVSLWDIEKDKERVIGDLNNITKIKKLKV